MLAQQLLALANPNAMFAGAGSAQCNCLLHNLIVEMLHDSALLGCVIKE
jgi:hypothetical protein